ncbi:hypothetical protein LGN13_19600 [Burkholderia multivorans]|uniref:hypothetical protein n=1 Tax=Burkholderia multivorans TaxID=87883 RepID=UPI00111FFB4E|nr:hypothetical protein [Burkholderia multivorans]MBU9669039.1 hypothetical protein [Burkholderia multivorans]MCA8503901.1 hypothetical protein [Burkholderia multivorans]MDN8082396.1 hypothetical protein [Burkholderia multivorans]HEF4753376.1 hypothetical protein [Burkholderia multivorans]
MPSGAEKSDGWPSARDGQAPDFNSLHASARGTARNGLVRFQQSCTVDEGLRYGHVHVSVSALQAYCSLENQTFRADLYADADSPPIAVKIRNKTTIGLIFATIAGASRAALLQAWVSRRRQRVPEPFGKIDGSVACAHHRAPPPSKAPDDTVFRS